MNHKKEFCDNCRKDVNIKVIEKTLMDSLKDKTYEYVGREAVCENCHHEIYLEEIIDYNLNQLYFEYRKKNDIIHLDQIREIPKRYNIGKRPLSLLLGWGELTFSRYFDGDLPSKQYSDVLKSIYNEPAFYLQLLEKNKDRLKAPITYQKTKKAADHLLDHSPHKKDSKLNTAINYLILKCEDITPLALQKALYYIQGFYYAFTGSYIFEEDCEAWVHGPVYRDIFYRYHSYRYEVIERTAVKDCDLLSGMELVIIDSVIKYLCCYSGKVLEQFTHMESPWLNARDGLEGDMGSDRIIEKDLIGNYFLVIKEKYHMVMPSDIANYSRDLFDKLV